MLDLEETEKMQILEAFQIVISHLKDSTDEASLTALAMLNEGKLERAKLLSEEASTTEWVLTIINTYLSSIYKQAVSLH